jgi:hypothetical protein
VAGQRVIFLIGLPHGEKVLEPDICGSKNSTKEDVAQNLAGRVFD